MKQNTLLSQLESPQKKKRKKKKEKEKRDRRRNRKNVVNTPQIKKMRERNGLKPTSEEHSDAAINNHWGRVCFKE